MVQTISLHELDDWKREPGEWLCTARDLVLDDPWLGEIMSFLTTCSPSCPGSPMIRMGGSLAQLCLLALMLEVAYPYKHREIVCAVR